MQKSEMVILLVEDNEDHAELIIRAISKQEIPVEIHHASDGEEAMDYLLRRGKFNDPVTSPVPCLILLDLRLPRLDGLAVLKQIKDSETLRLIPTVILTSSESENDIYSAYANHVNSFLVKPMDGQRFSSLIHEVEQYWLKLNKTISK